MTTPAALTDMVSGPAAAIGRYFSVLSVLPSVIFTTYAYALLASGAPSGQPDLAAAGRALADLGVRELALLGLVSLLLGLMLQPLQFTFVQLCEGYWGVGAAAQRGRAHRIVHHRRRYRVLVEEQENAYFALEDLGCPPGQAPAPAVPDPQVVLLSRYHEATRALGSYPESLNDIRPTRLGNVLRRYESLAGRAYDLPGVSIVPHLTLVAPDRDVAYVDDQRTQMDLAVRLAVLSALATALTVGCLWRSGLWLLLALLPYAACYAFYRGAVSQAHAYGTAVLTLIDLNRLALYERMGLEAVTSTEHERARNSRLAAILRDNDGASLALRAGQQSLPAN